MAEVTSHPDARVRRRAECPFCGRPGHELHAGLEDPLFGVPGAWSIRRCEDSGCGAHWIDPVVIEGDLHLLYETYYTHSDSASASLRRASSPLRRAMLAKVFGYETEVDARTRWLGALLARVPFLRERLGRSILWLDAAERGRVLDVGCGSGELLGHLSELGWETSGLEPDPRAAEHARTRGLDVHAGDLENAPWPPQTFDVISLVHVIEHVPNPRQTLERARELLRPGGKLIVVTPSVDSLGARRFGPSWRGWEVPRHLHLGGLPFWARLTREAGFGSVSARSCAIGAGRTYARSASIRRGNHHRGCDPDQAPGRDFRLASLLFEVFEFVAGSWPWRREIGEEVIVVARRRD